MTRFRDLPIRRKLTLISLLTSAVALLLACAGFVAYEQFKFKKELIENASTTAEMIGYNSVSALTFNDASSAEETLNALRAEPNIRAACIYDKEGRVFATYPRGQAPASFGALAAGETVRFGGDRFEFFQPIVVAGETVGTLYLRSDLAERRERLRDYALIIGAVMLVALLAAYLIAARLQRVISTPVSELAAIAGRVAADRDYTVRAVKRGNDELGRLIDGFNEMLAQIQARDSALGAARDTLEKRVADRTAELANSLALLKRAQEAAAHEQTRFKFIFESVPVGISLVAVTDARTHLVNPAHERITGVSAAESSVPGVFERATHPDDYRRQMELAQPFIQGEADHYSLEKRYVHPDGRVVWALLTSRKFTDLATGWQQSVTTLIDITERKEAEARLANSLSVLHATLEATADGILVVNHDGRLATFNRKFAAMWRIPPDVLAARDDGRVMRCLLAQLRDPGGFERKMRESYAAADESSFDAIEFTDGRVFERYSQPQRIEGVTAGRVWCFRDVTERKLAEVRLAETHSQLLDASRQAGMAEIATGVLHNVGNVLNSVNVSATVVSDHVRRTKAVNIAKLATLFEEHKADLAGFLTDDPRGRVIPAYLGTLGEALVTEHRVMLQELEHLRKNIDHIKDIVAMQQSYASTAGAIETVSVPDLIEDALRINAGSLARHSVDLSRDYQARPVVTTDKHKVMQILINLVRNAKYACDESGRTDKEITVRVTSDDHGVRITIIDNGVGIPAENLTRIFNHGFTTRKTGHGFGLHNGALAAKELGGSLTVRSAGPGQGAAFTLELPFKPGKPA